jgi:HlyD family secretion protein
MPPPFRRYGGWILLTAAVVALAFLVVRSRAPSVLTTKLRRTALEQHVVVSGRVRVPMRVQLSAQVSGLVVAVGASEGQRVEPGDLLVQINDAELRAAAAQGKAMVGQARARVDQLKRVGRIVATQALREAETNLEAAEVELARTNELFAKGALPKVELDDTRRAVERARAQRTAAEAQQIASSELGADSRLALTSLLEAQAQLAGAEARLSQTRILAVQKGLVLTRDVEPGDVVQPGRTLMVMAADSGVELVFEADERNVALIELGQKASVVADAYPERVFAAEVSYLAPSIDPLRGSVEVRLVVDDPPDFLKPEMTVSVDLTVASKKDAAVLPSEAVRGAMTPSPWVFVAEDGRVRRRPVKLGIRGHEAIEVVSGLGAGAEVVLPGGLRLDDGQRVRPSGGAP